MKLVFNSIFLQLTLVIALEILFQAFLIKSLYPIRFLPNTLFASDLLSIPITLPFWLMQIFGPVCALVFALIAYQIFSKKLAFVSALIFATSPWLFYLSGAASFYVFLLAGFLLAVLGYLYQHKKTNLAIAMMIFGTIIGSYSSFLLFISSPLVIGLLSWQKSGLNRKLIIFYLLSQLPLITLIIWHHSSFINILHREVTIFTDPGILNSINNFRGQSLNSDFKVLSKLTDNRIFYYGFYLLAGLITNLLPWSYFTFQQKLLNFSFTPPLFLGLMPAYLIGLFKLINHKNIRLLLIFVILTIPSLLSKNLIDLNRLILVLPLVILTITSGLQSLFTTKTKLSQFVLFTILLLVAIQLIIVLFDLSHFEFLRQNLIQSQTHILLNE